MSDELISDTFGLKAGLPQISAGQRLLTKNITGQRGKGLQFDFYIFGCIPKKIQEYTEVYKPPKTIPRYPLNKNGRGNQIHKDQKRSGWKYVRHKQLRQTRGH